MDKSPSSLSLGAALLAASMVGVQAVYNAVADPGFLLRPPGAQSEDDFLARCISCGRCIQACPYDAIQAAALPAGMSAGTPVINARKQACRLCEDFPCIAACPTKALAPVSDKRAVRMGTAVIDEELCVTLSRGIRCEVCYRACPLINEAIDIEYRPLAHDSTHAIFAPVINEEACVGCGICVERCVVNEPTVALSLQASRQASHASGITGPTLAL